MIRVNVAAAIVRDGHILVIEFDDDSGLHYNLPGGGVEEGESLHMAVQREVLEEAGVKIFVGALLMEWEYVPQHHNNRYGTQHKIGLIYEATLQRGQEPDPNHRHDAHQTGVRWLPLSQLLTAETVNFFGRDLLSAIHRLNRLRGDVDVCSPNIPIGTPRERNRQYSFNIFADNHMFVISQVNDIDDQDEGFVEEIYKAIEDYIYEGLDDKLYCADGRLIVGTARNLTVPVIIDILSLKPTPETIDTLISTASQVGICGLEVTSPALVIQSESFHDIEGVIEIEPGTYQVMIFYNDLDKQYNGATGDDWYHIIFYPGELVETKLIKTYIYTPKKR